MSALDDIIDAALPLMDEAENRYFGITDADPLDAAAAYPRLESMARAVLSVPALRDALARDAKVREIVERWRSTPWRHDPTTIQAIVHLYPEVASMLRDGKG